MKILHVIPAMDPKQGGMCQALKTMISGLSRQKVHNEVVSLDNHNAPFLIGTTFTVHALGQGKGSWSYNKRLIPWFLVNLTYFDVVIVHGLWQYPGFALRRAMKKLKKKAPYVTLPKLFVMPHGMLDPYFQVAPGRKLKAIRNTIYWKLIEKKLISEADGLLFTCEEELILANAPFYPYEPKREFVVGLSVNSPPPYSSAMKEAFLSTCPDLDNTPYLLFLGRIDKKKGIDLLIKAYTPVCSVLPKLVIAGPGLETPYGRKMKQLVLENEGLKDSIFFTGMLTGDAKWGAFYGCEAFILPSHQENFGIAVVEAMACAKPVLISNQVNIWREIQEGGSGYVSNDTREGVSKMLAFWAQASDKQKQIMSRNALYAFKRNFSTTAATTRLLEAIGNSHL